MLTLRGEHPLLNCRKRILNMREAINATIPQSPCGDSSLAEGAFLNSKLSVIKFDFTKHHSFIKLLLKAWRAVASLREGGGILLAK